MFNLTNSADPRVTHGKLEKMIVEPYVETPNVTFEFAQGYLQGATFFSLGVDSICLTGSDYEEFTQIQDDPEGFLVSKLGV